MNRCIPDYEFDSDRYEIIGGPWPNGCQNCESSSSSGISASSSSSSSNLSSSSSSSGGGDGDYTEYTCIYNCAPTLTNVYPPVEPGHFETQQECQTVCGGCTNACTFAPNAAGLCLVGDGWRSACGTFCQKGTYDGVPYYFKEYGSSGSDVGFYFHRRFGTTWYVRYTDGVDNWYAAPDFELSSNSDTPPLTGWTSYSGDCIIITHAVCS